MSRIAMIFAAFLVVASATPAMASYRACLHGTYLKLKKLDPNADFQFLAATARAICRKYYNR